MSHPRSEGRRARRSLQVLLPILAAATMACQSLFTDSPTPVQPIHHPSQPATASAAAATLLFASPTPSEVVQLSTTTATPPGQAVQLTAPTITPPPGADYQAQSGDTLGA